MQGLCLFHWHISPLKKTVCVYQIILELIIQKHVLSEPWEFPPSLKTLHVTGTQSCEEIEELTEPLQLLCDKND